MKIIVTGTRGVPNIQGGVETHCEELYPRLARMNYEIELVRRSCYVPINDHLKEFKGVRLKTIFTIRRKTIETVLHTFLAVLWAKRRKTDILHIHAIGPAILVPFARLLGMKVVFTHHGPDYDRAKWGPFAKYVLKVGERLGTKFSNEVIVISEVIRESLFIKYKRSNSHLIFNGVTPPTFITRTDYIESLGLKPRKFVFTLGRFVEEKGFDLLIRAFSNIEQSEFKLVIAGDADHEIPYSKHLKKLALANNVVLPGFIKGEELQQLFSHAGIFVLPSFHEGLPISLLEAMSYNLPVIVSDIPANKMVLLPEQRYFITGDEESLKKSLNELLLKDYQQVEYDMTPYDWDKIAVQTASVYEKIYNSKKTKIDRH